MPKTLSNKDVEASGNKDGSVVVLPIEWWSTYTGIFSWFCSKTYNTNHCNSKWRKNNQSNHCGKTNIQFVLIFLNEMFLNGKRLPLVQNLSTTLSDDHCLSTFSLASLRDSIFRHAIFGPVVVIPFCPDGKGKNENYTAFLIF